MFGNYLIVTFVIFKLMNSHHWVWSSFYLHLNIDVSALTHATTVSFHVSCYHLVAKYKTICIISYIWNNWQASKPHCWWCSAALASSTHLQTNNNNRFDSWFIKRVLYGGLWGQSTHKCECKQTLIKKHVPNQEMLQIHIKKENETWNNMRT